MNIAELTPAAGFVLLVLLIFFNSLELKKKGVHVSAAETRKPGNIKWFYPFFAVFFLLFLTEIFSPLYGLSLLPKGLTSFLFNSVAIRLTGVLAVFISVYILKIALHHFGNSLRFGLNESNIGKLVTSGVFARTRNPFFMSLLLFFAGTALVFPNLFFLFFAVSAFAGIHFSILKEEKFLKQVYGDEYLSYQRKVRRYF
ncbi:MAG: isoprenylcysteine carboxylmethyltransferase family protein [Draconibacterium sp.]